MLVDKTEFEAWMERIMGELYRISRKLDKAENRQKHLNYLNGERLYDNQEVTAAHQQAHAPAIPEQRGVEVPFDIPQDLLQRIRPARVHPQQFRRERNQASGTEGQAVGNLSDARRNG